MNVTEIRAKMEKLNDFILKSEETVRGGKIVDLSGIDTDVSQICTRAVALPPEQAREVQPMMAELIGNLERLSGALNDFKNRIKP